MECYLNAIRDVFLECHLVNCQKGFIPGSVPSLIPDEAILGGTSGLPVVQFSVRCLYKVHPETVNRSEVLA